VDVVGEGYEVFVDFLCGVVVVEVVGLDVGDYGYFGMVDDECFVVFVCFEDEYVFVVEVGVGVVFGELFFD